MTKKLKELISNCCCDNSNNIASIDSDYVFSLDSSNNNGNGSSTSNNKFTKQQHQPKDYSLTVLSCAASGA